MVRAVESWPLVLIVAPTLTRANALRRACVLAVTQSQNPFALGSEFRVANREDVVGPDGPLGPIWEAAGRSGRERLLPVDQP